MSRPIDYRSTSPFPAERMYAAMSDPQYLRDRLARLGGKGAGLVEHTATGPDVRYRLRQGLDKDLLPPIAQSFVPGDLVIERAESIHPDPAGGYRGDVDVRVPGAPVAAAGSMRLTTAGTGSAFAVHADVKVNVPLFGGRIEAVVAEQVQRLLAAETAFTLEWIARHPG
jgi:Protein of unknown function (DUF2505)